MLKILSGLMLILNVSCQTKIVNLEKNTKSATDPIQNQKIIIEEELANEPEKTKVEIKQPEKIALLFSSGGVHTWSFLTLLKEIQKYKLPITAVAGVEWGAVIAAIYAENQSPNEVEWELSKFKNISNIQDFIKTIFEKKTIENSKIPFACSSYNLKSKKSNLLNTGELTEIIQLCLPSQQAGTKPYKDSLADQNELSGLVQFLKKNGASKIIYLNILSSPQFSNLKTIGIDEIINIDVEPGLKADQFESRKKIMNLSLGYGKDRLKIIVEKFGY